jgi:hypothetical protein
MPLTGGYKSLETGQNGLSDLEVQRRLMLCGYNGLARNRVGFSPTDVALLKIQLFAILIGQIVILCQSEETHHGRTGCVKGFRGGCSFSNALQYLKARNSNVSDRILTG